MTFLQNKTWLFPTVIIIKITIFSPAKTDLEIWLAIFGSVCVEALEFRKSN